MSTVWSSYAIRFCMMLLFISCPLALHLLSSHLLIGMSSSAQSHWIFCSIQQCASSCPCFMWRRINPAPASQYRIDELSWRQIHHLTFGIQEARVYLSVSFGPSLRQRTSPQIQPFRKTLLLRSVAFAGIVLEQTCLSCRSEVWASLNGFAQDNTAAAKHPCMINRYPHQREDDLKINGTFIWLTPWLMMLRLNFRCRVPTCSYYWHARLVNGAPSEPSSAGALDWGVRVQKRNIINPRKNTQQLGVKLLI